MPFEIMMPQLGLTMETGTLLNWLVGAGDRFVPGQEIFEVETDKATVAVEAHQEGIIERVLVQVGQEVPVGAVVAVAVAPGETLPAGWQPAQPAEVSAPTPERTGVSVPSLSTLSAAGELRASWKARVMARQAGLGLGMLVGSGPGGRIVADDVVRAQAAPTPEPEEVSVSPAAAQLAAALGLDLCKVTGSGPRGRIMRADVLEAAAALVQIASGQTLTPVPTQVSSAVLLTGVRGVVSERMATSAHTTARVTLFREVDATALIDLRERFGTQGIQVSYNDILARVCATALREHPAANARMGEGQIEELAHIHVGIAVDTDRGLLVPVIHDADTLTIPQIAAESARLIASVRSGRGLPDELTGGTFTLTSLGMFGVEGFTPVINLPECCILGVGRFVRKPVVVGGDDAVVVRPMMMLSLAFDHRVIDGAPAARFLDRIAKLVEDPLLLL